MNHFSPEDIGLSWNNFEYKSSLDWEWNTPVLKLSLNKGNLKKFKSAIEQNRATIKDSVVSILEVMESYKNLLDLWQKLQNGVTERKGLEYIKIEESPIKKFFNLVFQNINSKHPILGNSDISSIRNDAKETINAMIWPLDKFLRTLIDLSDRNGFLYFSPNDQKVLEAIRQGKELNILIKESEQD